MERAFNEDHRRLVQYAEELSSPEPPYLYHLRRATHQRTLAPQMLSGHLQGRLLSMISKMMAPRYIVEVGTFTGYSTLCLAEGLKQPDGQIITIEVNEELRYLSEHYIKQSPYSDLIHQQTGNAIEILPTLSPGIDLVWIDAAKKDYQDYYDLVFPKVKKGGIIMADNVLWDGKVVASSEDAVTQALQDFNATIAADDRVEQVLLPMRDGITIVRKR